MTPVGRFLRRVAEKYLGRFYEGPEAPDRLRVMITAFANDFPKATRSQWVEFAVVIAEEAYRTGWTRGFEHVERQFDWKPGIPPEVLADQIDPRWSDPRRGISLVNGELVVPDVEEDEGPPPPRNYPVR